MEKFSIFPIFFIIIYKISRSREIESLKKKKRKKLKEEKSNKHFNNICNNATLKGKEREREKSGGCPLKNRAALSRKKRTGKEKIIKRGVKEILVENATKPRKLRNCHEPLLTRRRAFDPR